MNTRIRTTHVQLIRQVPVFNYKGLFFCWPVLVLACSILETVYRMVIQQIQFKRFIRIHGITAKKEKRDQNRVTPSSLAHRVKTDCDILYTSGHLFIFIFDKTAPVRHNFRNIIAAVHGSQNVACKYYIVYVLENVGKKKCNGAATKTKKKII